MATNREPKTDELRSSIFMTLPSKMMYPDYYSFIKEPIALNPIRRKIEALKYPRALPPPLRAPYFPCGTAQPGLIGQILRFQWHGFTFFAVRRGLVGVDMRRWRNSSWTCC